MKKMQEAGCRIVQDRDSGSTYAILRDNLVKIGCSSVMNILRDNECFDENGMIVNTAGDFTTRYGISTVHETVSQTDERLFGRV